MPTATIKRYSPQEYLVSERAAEYRSEFYRGEIFAMAGDNRQHNRICVNLTGELQRRLKGGPYQGFSGNMRLLVQATGLYTYPDLPVGCGELQFEDAEVDTLLNPTIIFEVLPPSTESHDRGWKFDQYRQIPSLQEYVLLAQDQPRIERFERSHDESWRWSVTTGLDAQVSFAAIRCLIPLSEIYADVQFEPSKREPSAP